MNISSINNIKYNNNISSAKKQNPNFRAAAPAKNFGDKIGEFCAKYYAKPLYNKMWLQRFSEQVAKVPGSYTEHMSALGSAITSSVYMKRTLDNKDLDNDKKKTLAVNQGLCFVIPTILSYWVNGKLLGFNKKQEYKYAGIQEAKKANGLIPPEKLKEFEAKLGDRLKGFKTLSSLLTFTLIYRYASPVIITPLANKVGAKLNSNKKEAKKTA